MNLFLEMNLLAIFLLKKFNYLNKSHTESHILCSSLLNKYEFFKCINFVKFYVSFWNFIIILDHVKNYANYYYYYYMHVTFHLHVILKN
jgi:hypothetical protein